MNTRPTEVFAELLIDSAAKGTVLLLMACLATWLLRRSSAAARHIVWSLTLLSLILLPVVSCCMPVWRISILPAIVTAESTAISRPVAAIREARPVPQKNPGATNTPARPDDVAESVIQPVSLPMPVPARDVPARLPDSVQSASLPEPAEWTSSIILVGWVAGLTASGLVLALIVLRVGRFRRRSKSIVGGSWSRLLSDLKLTLQVRRAIELREHSEPIVPLTCGVLRPAVLLPESARQWDEPLQRTVLLHELAHVRRSDVAWLLVGRVACALFWFHPLAWFALRRLRHESELACDDAVVHAGEKATDYAEQLLNVARLCCAPRGLSMGVAMAEGSSLEHRIKSLFDSTRNHRPVRRIVSLGILLVAGLTLALIAAVHPVSQTAQAEVDPADVTTTDVASTADGAVEKAATKPPGLKWTRGTAALERIVQLKPLFGEARNGLKLGIAWPTPQRVFRIGDQMPVELFLMNVSDRDVSTQFVLNFMAYPPHLEDSRGNRIDIPRLITFMARPVHKITLKPGEACGIPARGLGIGTDGPAMSFKSPTEGRYHMTYQLAGVSSGRLGFDVVTEKTGELRVKAHYTEPAGMGSPERMSILKPIFGKPGHGIEMGLAFGTTQRTFADGEIVPVEVFLRSASKQNVSFKFHPDFMPYPLGIVGPDGKRIDITPLMHWMFIPPLDLNLKPGEAHAVTTHGLRLSQSRQPLHFVPSKPGKYRVVLTRGIWGGNKPNDWQEQLTAGSLDFEILQKEKGKPRVRIAARDDGGKREAGTRDAPASKKVTSQPAKATKTNDESAKEKEPAISLKEVVWWEKADGIQAGFLLTSPARPNRRVPANSTATYRVIVRNTTEKPVHFNARLLPVEHRDAPYLIPSDSIATAFDDGEPPKKFRATGGRPGQKEDPSYVIRLAPREAAFIPGMSGGNDVRLYVGNGTNGDSARVVRIQPGMNWIVQPLQIRQLSLPRKGLRLEGRFELTKIDASGKLRQESADRMAGVPGGKTLYPRIQLDVGTLTAAAARNAKNAIWGKVDKGLQCGIRLLKPKRKAYGIGDSLEAELLWRNTSDKSIWSPMPKRLDLYPLIHDSEGKFKLIDFGARFTLLPISHEFHPGEVRSLGLFKIKLVAEGTPSPKSNAEPAHVTLSPGTYDLSGSGGVSAPDGGRPRSGRIEFRVTRR